MTTNRSDRWQCLRYPDGKYYQGECIPHSGGVVAHGEGTMQYYDGSAYRGSWVLDRRHGNGEMHYANRDKYKGGWKDDKREGYGEHFRSEDKRTYKGGWHDDQ